MIRDDKMQQLVSCDKEPISPFISKARSLFEELNVSSILVIGGSGDYFDIADQVFMMDCYQCLDVTERAKEISRKSLVSNGDNGNKSSNKPFGKIVDRYPVPSSFNPNGKVSVRSKSIISYGNVDLDLSSLEQVTSQSQTNAILAALTLIPSMSSSGKMSLSDLMIGLRSKLDIDGLELLSPNSFHGGLAMPRIYEIAAAINRLRRHETLVQK